MWAWTSDGQRHDTTRKHVRACVRVTATPRRRNADHVAATATRCSCAVAEATTPTTSRPMWLEVPETTPAMILVRI